MGKDSVDIKLIKTRYGYKTNLNKNEMVKLIEVNPIGFIVKYIEDKKVPKMFINYAFVEDLDEAKEVIKDMTQSPANK